MFKYLIFVCAFFSTLNPIHTQTKESVWCVRSVWLIRKASSIVALPVVLGKINVQTTQMMVTLGQKDGNLATVSFQMVLSHRRTLEWY